MFKESLIDANYEDHRVQNYTFLQRETKDIYQTEMVNYVINDTNWQRLFTYDDVIVSTHKKHSILIDDTLLLK